MLYCMNLILIIFCISFTVAQQTNIRTLKLTQVLFRHGDRAPGGTYPTDPTRENDWYDGWSQLTKKGMEQTFELGRFLRRRYSGFLSEKYSRREFYAISSNTDRALQSGQCALAGLFPWAYGQAVMGLGAQPIPLHARFKKNDPYLKVGKKCPQLDKLEKKMIKKEWPVLEERFRALLQYLTMNAGYSKPIGIDEANTIYGAMHAKRAHNLTWPSWMNDAVFNQLIEIKTISRLIEMDEQEEIRLNGGVIGNEIVEVMQHKIDGDTPDLKMKFYSAHRSTVIALMQALNIFNYQLPPYAACVIVELHETFPGNYQVKSYYRNSTTDDQVYAVGNDSFNQFVQKANQYLITDVNQYACECKRKQKTPKCEDKSSDSDDEDDD